jgi:hypothetical protein
MNNPLILILIAFLFLSSPFLLMGASLSNVEASCLYAFPDYGWADLRDGKLDITLYPDTGLIEGEATLSSRISGRPGKFPFELHRRANIKSIQTSKNLHLKWCRDGDLVVVSLPPEIQGNQHVVILIKWLVKVGGPSLKGAITPYLTEKGAYLPSSLLWHPRGVQGDGARWQMTVKSPVKWKMEATGIRHERYFKENGLFQRFRMDQDVYGLALVAGELRQVERKWFGGGALSCYSPWEMASKSNLRLYGDDFGNVLKFFKRHFGEPCFKSYSIVEMAGTPLESDFRIGAENSFMVVSAPPLELRGSFLEFVTTELGRHWIGSTGAVHDSLAESLAIYLGLLAVRKLDGPNAFLTIMRKKARIFEDASTYSGNPNLPTDSGGKGISVEGANGRLSAIKGLGNNVSLQTYDILVRKKGPLLLACLEEACGGVKTFVGIVRKFLDYHRRNGSGGWTEFMGTYERVTGIDLSNFALLYIDGPGLPPEVARRIGYDKLPPVEEK